MNIDDRITEIKNDEAYVLGSLDDILYSEKPEIHILKYRKTDGLDYEERWLVENGSLFPIIGGINE